MSDGIYKFFVPGKPMTAGSKRAFAHRHTGRIVVVDDCKGGKPWRKAVAFHSGVACKHPLMGPLVLEVAFFLPRPLSHRLKDGSLARGAPRQPITKPDATKLLRAIEDALTGIAWIDDAQIVRQVVEKRYADGAQKPGALVTVYTEGMT
jgi:Holliday junction resolvase RusA-like endonuclease